jgi:hypothetical protein
MQGSAGNSTTVLCCYNTELLSVQLEKIKERNVKSKIEIYKTPNNQTELKVQFDKDTVWLSQSQMADLFDKDVRTINEHIKNMKLSKVDC